MGLPQGLDPNAYLPGKVRKELNLPGSISIGNTSKQAKFVQERLTLAGFATGIDQDFGPATQQQVRNYQTSKGLPVSGVYTQAVHDLITAPFVSALAPVPIGNGVLGDVIVAVGRQHVDQHPREAGGDNKGPWVRMYMGGNDGSEWRWCAGFVFFVMAQACHFLDRPLPMKRTYSVDTIVERAKATGRFVKESDVSNGNFPRADIVPGSLFVVRNTSIDWTHVGIVVQADAQSFVTFEGNTNDDGSANGFEAVERVRGYSSKDFVVW